MSKEFEINYCNARISSTNSQIASSNTKISGYKRKIKALKESYRLIQTIKSDFRTKKNALVTLQRNADNSWVGNLFNTTYATPVEDLVAEVEKVIGKIDDNLDNINDILSNNQLFYKEFHFSKSYFKTLEKKGVHDSVETYDKNITYVEQKLSQYSKIIISRYSLSTEAEVTIEVGKQRGGENSFNYLIIHNIFDKEKKITVRRTCVIELENTYDE